MLFIFGVGLVVSGIACMIEGVKTDKKKEEKKPEEKK